MKRIVCVASTLATIALLAGARTQESATIKEVMDKLHKGGSARLAKLKTALPGRVTRLEQGTRADQGIRKVRCAA